MSGPDGRELLETLTGRADLLRRLRDGPVHKRDLVEELDASRSTVDRAVRELASLGLVERRDDGHAATVTGRLAVEQLSGLEATLGDLAARQDVLAPLAADAPIDAAAVAGSEALRATEPAPYRPVERFHDELEAAERYRAVLPSLDDPRHIRLLYEHVVTRGRPAELVVSADLLATLRAEFPRRLAAMAGQEGFELLVAEALPPYALALVDTDSGAVGTVGVVVFADGGAVHGVVLNRSDDAYRWAERRYDDIREPATARSAELVDKGGRAAEPAADDGADGVAESMPVGLEAAGFVRLDIDYFRDAPVADPLTAWRAGLSLAEVHTGYAVARSPDRGAGSEDGDAGGDGDAGRDAGGAVEKRTDDGTIGANDTLAGRLTSRLTGGEDCVLVGAPGSGKSTTCKRVACEWYDADRGPVFYRESGHGRPFDAADDLLTAVEGSDGHALVVVEDAVRPESAAVFETVDRLAGRDDVAVLLDAREGEWTDPPDGVDPAADLVVETMPPLDAADAKRVIERFEQTIGEGVDVPADRLLAAARDAAGGDATAPGGLILLLHRLATYADPLAETATSLEAAAAALYDDLAGDDTALDVAILAHVLNAAGLAVAPDMLYAVVDPDNFGAVDAARDRLEGRMLFPRPDGAYRAVHELWSTAFLEHLLEVEGGAKRFGRVVSRLLALADAPDRRATIADHLSDRWALAAIDDDPAGWVAGAAETVHALGCERPKLAPLFGDGDADTIALPAATPAATAEKVPVWLGRAFIAGSHYDRAERAFERLPADGHRGVERLLGLARIAVERGAYDDAADRADRAHMLAADREAGGARARADLRGGRALAERAAYDAARERYRSALAGFEAAGDRRGAARTLRRLGSLERRDDDYERATEFHRRSLEIAREVGDRAGEAAGHRALGQALWSMGDYEAARDHVRQSLDRYREVGDRAGVFNSLNLLGAVVKNIGEFDRARECFERALAVARDHGMRAREEDALGNVALTAARQGDYGAAREDVEAALAIAEEVGEPRSVAIRSNNLGLIAVRQADHEVAREAFARGNEIAAERGLRHREVNSLNGLGHVARLQGRFDDARGHHEAALEGAREIGNRRAEADCYNKLGLVALDRGDHGRAGEWFRDGLQLARELDQGHERTVSLRGLAAAAVARGDRDAAAEHLEAARELSVDGGAAVVREQIRLTAARFALARDDHEAASERANAAREAFAGMDSPQWAARARRLVGRVAADAADHERAREYLETALETFEDIGADADMVATLIELVEVCEAADEAAAAARWRRRAGTITDAAPAAAVEPHHERLTTLKPD